MTNKLFLEVDEKNLSNATPLVVTRAACMQAPRRWQPADNESNMAAVTATAAFLY